MEAMRRRNDAFAAMPRFTFGQPARPPGRSGYESEGNALPRHATGIVTRDLQFGLLVAGLRVRS